MFDNIAKGVTPRSASDLHISDWTKVFGGLGLLGLVFAVGLGTTSEEELRGPRTLHGSARSRATGAAAYAVVDAVGKDAATGVFGIGGVVFLTLAVVAQVGANRR